MVSPQHVTLVANTVATLSFPASTKVEVVNVDGAAAVYFTTNGATPTVAGDGCYVVTAGVGAYVTVDTGSGASPVSLISAGAPKVSVAAW